MTGNLILSRFLAFGSQFQALFQPGSTAWPDMHRLWQRPALLPKYASETPVVKRTLDLLGPLDGKYFPERNLQRNWGQAAVSYAAFAGAVLVKLNEGLETMGGMRRCLVEHPGLIPLLGFRVLQSRTRPYGFDPDASLPTQRHLTQMLRDIPNPALQFLLADTVRLIREELRQHRIEMASASAWIPNISWPGSKRTTRKPMSKGALTKPSSPLATRIANWAANAATTRKGSSPWARKRHLHPRPTHNLAKTSSLAISIGVMVQALWLPKRPVGAKLSLQN